MYARVKCAKISLMELQFNANCKMKTTVAIDMSFFTCSAGQ